MLAAVTSLALLLGSATILSNLPTIAFRAFSDIGQRCSNAFAIILAQKNGGEIETNKLNTQQAKNFFSNELAIQLLKACPSRLSTSEKANIEAMQAEILKRKNSQ